MMQYQMYMPFIVQLDKMKGGPGSSVGILSGYGLDDRAI
jgi:hypothetical protein